MDEIFALPCHDLLTSSIFAPITISGNDRLPRCSFFHDSTIVNSYELLCFTFSLFSLNTFIRRIPLPFFETFPIIEYSSVTKKFASKLSRFDFEILIFLFHARRVKDRIDDRPITPYHVRNTDTLSTLASFEDYCLRGDRDKEIETKEKGKKKKETCD